MANPVRRSRVLCSLAGMFLAATGTVVTAALFSPLQAQTAADGGTITLRSDIQEANALTGVITARGNVQIDYPARQIQATSAQAQYFSNERRIILSGNVLVVQEGNTLRAETVTYLIDEGRFVALPNPDQQVEAVYIVPESEVAPESSPAPAQAPPRPEPDATLNLPPTRPGDTTGAEPPTSPPSRSAPLQ